LQLTVEKPSPSGAIASVTSSDPAKLVVSRSATALGSGSISGDILPNSQTMYPFYLQALEGSGNVRVTVSVEGHADAVFDVALLPSWLQLFAGSVGGLVSVSPGNPVTVTLAPAFLKPGDFYSRTGAMRAGLDTLRVGLQAGSQGVLSGVPETVELRPGTNATFSIQAAARGDTTIQIAPNQMFGDPPPAIEPIIFRVRSSAAAFSSSNCYQLILGRDTQKDCSFNNSVPANFTIRSEQPELLLVSQNRDQPGRAEISGPLSGFTIQGLGSEGTAEVVVSAPGFADLRIAVMLRPSTVAIANISSGVEFAVRANATTDLRLGLFPLGPNWSGIEDPLRAGLSIPVDISATPSGVISVEPARVLMGTTYESRTFKLRGLTPGTAVLRIRAEGYAESSASTLMLRVIP
jgi:hypothetical protein